MKKILFAALISSMMLSACSSLNHQNMSRNVKKITWETAGKLPAQKGSVKNVGTAGLLQGVLNDKFIVVGGGANFPVKGPGEGGPKVTYSDVYVLQEVDGRLDVVEHTNFPHEIGYGSSFTTPEGIYYIGGAPNADNSNDIWLLTMVDGKVKFDKVGDLPFTYQSGAAAIKDNMLYIVGGKQAGKNSTSLFRYDLKTGETTELAPIPGETRSQPVSQILNGELFVFGGGNSKAFVDGYRYDFANNRWTAVAPISIDGREISVLGGNSVKLNDDEMLVIGGFNRQVWDDANFYLSTLKGDELAAYKANYFATDPVDFSWNKEILVYNAKTDSWKTLGEVPFDAPCGEALIHLNGKVFSINGEIKPGVRTSRMYTGHLK